GVPRACGRSKSCVPSRYLHSAGSGEISPSPKECRGLLSWAMNSDVVTIGSPGSIVRTDNQSNSLRSNLNENACQKGPLTTIGHMLTWTRVRPKYPASRPEYLRTPNVQPTLVESSPPVESMVPTRG
ncbi:hypothetical protein PISMIDRAFT_682710, partial [Pisolithus microcarpus 441]